MRIRAFGYWIVFVWLLLGCTKTSVSEKDILFEIIASNEAFEKEVYPSLSDNYNRLPDMSESAVEKRVEFARDIIARLKAIDQSNLNFEDQTTLRLFQFVQEDLVAQYDLNGHLIPILADDGFHISFAFTADAFSFTSKRDYINYIGVLNSFPEYVDQHIILMRKGLELGMVQPKIILNGYEVTYDNHIVENVEESIFYEPFQNLPSTCSNEEREEILDSGQKAIVNGVIEGYRRFSDFMSRDYIPGARTTIGAKDLPNGNDFYSQRIKYFTTLSLSPDSIHNLGLQEVARIKSEMMAIIEEVSYDGSFEEFLQFLRTDKQFYANTPAELLKEAAWISKSMDGKLPQLFGKLPRQPYTVNPVPDHLAPKYTGGRYVPGSLEANQPGQYWVNTYALENRPLYILEALSFHEAVPGHHLQETLSRELTHLPAFRQSLYLSVFGEGWGLYSEFLGVEVGFYKDPYSRFGRLTYEMWRACRLVVDTGIHAKGWTRQQVMDYLSGNTALSIHEITTETDRYISWPGQALAYKIGELKIKALRKKTTEKLGEDFDIREFHDLILSQGTVTLDIMEQMVDRYIEMKLSKKE
ncbi:MAG: DUF885 domain-containing protein [Reichenbachiella sp.]|uniref:DUF885 domain-containing protein n=1 Tax=Reichenbachiella sp. TaxID=2184521 RepID=UPI003263747E